MFDHGLGHAAAGTGCQQGGAVRQREDATAVEPDCECQAAAGQAQHHRAPHRCLGCREPRGEETGPQGGEAAVPDWKAAGRAGGVGGAGAVRPKTEPLHPAAD